jgi:two-component SAPR family response regulator
MHPLDQDNQVNDRLVILKSHNAQSYDYLRRVSTNTLMLSARITANGEIAFSALRQQSLGNITADTLGDAEALFLDDADLANETELSQFVKHWLAQLPHLRIIIMTRHISSLWFQDENLRQITTFIPSQYEQNQSIAMSSDEHHLYVQALGTGRVWLKGVEIKGWENSLPYYFFFFIVHHGMVPRERIFETFWSHLSRHEATNIFHVTKGKLNDILGIKLTTFASGYYRLSPKIVLQYDVQQFTQALQNMMFDAPSDIPYLENIVGMYRGHYLNGDNMPWIEEKRQQLLLSYTELLFLLAQKSTQNQQLNKAIRYFSQILHLCPEHEDATHGLMDVYWHQGKPHEACKVFERIQHVLTQNNKAPQEKLVTLYQQCLAKASNV